MILWLLPFWVRSHTYKFPGDATRRLASPDFGLAQTYLILEKNGPRLNARSSPMLGAPALLSARLRGVRGASPKRVIVTPAVYPRLDEFLHFDIQSTGQKSHRVNTDLGHRDAMI